jgi:F0F1-type ATP synthase assembly protein I
MPPDEADHEPTRGGRLARAATSSRGAAYEGAMEAIFAILVGVGLGYWADSYFETGPRYLILGAVVGFAAFVLRLFRMSKLLEAAPEDAIDEAPTRQETSAQRSVASRSGDEDRILPPANRPPSGDQDRAD